MLKIVSFKICPFVQRVTASLEQKNIPYEIEYISLKNKPSWFTDISPNGQVPLLITENNKVLFESDAIIEYINDLYGRFYDLSAEDKAIHRAWSYLGSKNYLKQCGLMREKEKKEFIEKLKNFHSSFDKIERELDQNKDYFKSNVIGDVDIAWYPIFYRFDIIEKCTGYDFYQDYTKIKRWKNNLLNNNKLKNSVSKDFCSEFCSFYLNNSYLSTLRKC